jgi:hypothetical protein
MAAGDHARVLQATARATSAPDCAAFYAAFETLKRALHAALETSAVAAAGVSARVARANMANKGLLFTDAAGITVFGADVPQDHHGNAKGADYDLGQDGAFEKFPVCVYAQYTSGLLPALRGQVSEALRRKGFPVTVVETLPSGAELQESLKGFSQLWLLSDCKPILSADDVAIIVREWREQRLALYVFGDNEPFYHDANVLLREIGLPPMQDNYGGGKYCEARGVPAGTPLHELPAATVVNHFTTTGIRRLYEGITIAHFDLKRFTTTSAAKVASDESPSLASRCVPVMVNTEGRVSVFVLEAEGSSAALIADGAFTKLFCSWDTAGSARFVVNCACYLAANSRAVGDVQAQVELPTAAEAGAAAEPAAESAAPCPSLTDAGALRGTCAITFDTEQVLALLLARVPVEVTQTDAALNSPLAQGAALAPFVGRQAYGLDGAAKALLVAGFDPFTRQELVAALPAVDLSFPANLTLFQTALCAAFTGGKARYRHVSLLLFGVVDELLCRDDGGGDIADVLQYMREQMLLHVQCASDFGFSAKRAQPTGTLSKAVPLREAMLYVACAVPAPQRVLLLDAVSTCLVIRTLAARCAPHVKASDLVAWLRHAYVFFVLQCAAARQCARVTGGLAADNAFEDAFGSAYFDMELGVCIANTGRVAPFDSDAFAAVQAAAVRGMPAAQVASTLQAFARAAACLGLSHALGTPETAVALFVLVREQRKLPSATRCSAEACLNTALGLGATAHYTCFGSLAHAVWSGSVTADAALEALNAPFNDRYFNDAPVEPFATCLGPSVFESKSGGVTWFPWQQVLADADGPRRLTGAELDDVRSRRAAYLRRVYATGDDGSMRKDSANFPLHRCVRDEMIQESNRDLMRAADDPARADAIARAVAARLVADGRGAYMQAGLEAAVRFAIDSYLERRRAGGMRELRGAECLSLSCIAYEELVQRHRGIV